METQVESAPSAQPDLGEFVFQVLCARARRRGLPLEAAMMRGLMARCGLRAADLITLAPRPVELLNQDLGLPEEFERVGDLFAQALRRHLGLAPLETRPSLRRRLVGALDELRERTLQRLPSALWDELARPEPAEPPAPSAGEPPRAPARASDTLAPPSAPLLVSSAPLVPPPSAPLLPPPSAPLAVGASLPEEPAPPSAPLAEASGLGGSSSSVLAVSLSDAPSIDVGAPPSLDEAPSVGLAQAARVGMLSSHGALPQVSSSPGVLEVLGREAALAALGSVLHPIREARPPSKARLPMFRAPLLGDVPRLRLPLPLGSAQLGRRLVALGVLELVLPPLALLPPAFKEAAPPERPVFESLPSLSSALPLGGLLPGEPIQRAGLTKRWMSSGGWRSWVALACSALGAALGVPVLLFGLLSRQPWLLVLGIVVPLLGLGGDLALTWALRRPTPPARP
jgi:hypothetical protein